MKEQQRAVKNFFNHMEKLRQIAAYTDDNKTIDQCTLDGARLWHRLSEEEKTLAFGMTNYKELLEMFNTFQKYSLEVWEKYIPEMYKYNTFEEWKAAQEEK
jgi:hypothetical protein